MPKDYDPLEEEYGPWPSLDSDGSRETDPKEVSLFIGGKEFDLDGVGDESGPSLLMSLRTARQELLGEIAHPENSGLLHDMTEDQAVAFLKARLDVLERLIEGVNPLGEPLSSSRGEPEVIDYGIPR